MMPRPSPVCPASSPVLSLVPVNDTLAIFKEKVFAAVYGGIIMSKEPTKRIAKRFLQAMAYDRETFKDKAQECIGCAYLEFCKATLARKNGRSQWVPYWMAEVQTLLDRNLVTVIKHEVRGFKDRRKALAEVIASLKAKDMSYRASAEHVVKRDYKLTKLTSKLDDKDTEAFWARVEEAIEIGFAGEETAGKRPSPSRARHAAER